MVEMVFHNGGHLQFKLELKFFPQMLFIHILTATAFARIYAQTSVSNYLVKRSPPAPTVPAIVGSQTDQLQPIEYNSEHMGIPDDLEDTQSNSELESIFHPAKRHRIDPATVTEYKLLRNLTTVYEVWNEYKYGLNGNPSVESILHQNQTEWPVTNNERKYYNLRKRIYDYILNAAHNGMSEADAVIKLEKLRVENKWSLRTLQLSIGSLSFDKESGQVLSTEPVNKMFRNLTTVPQVWQEYKYGMNGNPAVESFENRFKFLQRSSDAEYQYYIGRSKIYRHIMSAIANGTAEFDAINELEALRVAQRWSLNDLQLSISLLYTDESTGKLMVAAPEYVLWRNLTKVGQVWQEYKYGLNGGPSVESIVQELGTSWLKTKSQKRYYFRRKRIYDYILHAIAGGKSENDAVNELENYRKSNHWSLYTLQEKIQVSKIKRTTHPPVPSEVADENRVQSPIHDDDDSLFAEILNLLE